MQKALQVQLSSHNQISLAEMPIMLGYRPHDYLKQFPVISENQ